MSTQIQRNASIEGTLGYLHFGTLTASDANWAVEATGVVSFGSTYHGGRNFIGTSAA